MTLSVVVSDCAHTRRVVAARGDVDRAADALGWTAAALETLLVDHPHWWPREELGPRG